MHSFARVSFPTRYKIISVSLAVWTLEINAVHIGRRVTTNTTQCLARETIETIRRAWSLTDDGIFRSCTTGKTNHSNVGGTISHRPSSKTLCAVLCTECNTSAVSTTHRSEEGTVAACYIQLIQRCCVTTTTQIDHTFASRTINRKGRASTSTIRSRLERTIGWLLCWLLSWFSRRLAWRFSWGLAWRFSWWLLRWFSGRHSSTI
jgi:hypothetical protein